jgi:hypothetical protein
MSLHCFIIYHIILESVIGVETENCQYFRKYLIISWKKEILALHLVRIDTDSDWQVLDASPDPKKMVPIRPDSDPDQQH